MIKKTIRDHKRIIFNGNGYDDAWIKEATEKRGLLNYRTTADCMPHLLDKKNADMLLSLGVFTQAELESRCEIMLENYCKSITIEAQTMLSMTRTQILPAVENYTAVLAKNALKKKAFNSALACGYETETIGRLSACTDEIAKGAALLAASLEKLSEAGAFPEESALIRDHVLPAMESLRRFCDEAETLTSKEYWPFPTYPELLFGV